MRRRGPAAPPGPVRSEQAAVSDELFADVQPSKPKRKRDRTGAAHYCPCCGGRTYRRRRIMPGLGVVDDRCQRCVTLNAWPEQHTDQTRKDRTVDL